MGLGSGVPLPSVNGRLLDARGALGLEGPGEVESSLALGLTNFEWVSSERANSQRANSQRANSERTNSERANSAGAIAIT